MSKRFFTPIDFTNTAASSGTVVDPPARQAQWDYGDGTMSIGLTGGNVKLPVGQQSVVKVYNATPDTLTVGQAVYVYGAQGQRPSVKLGLAITDETSSKVLGLVAESIASGAEGYVTTFGVLKNINTASFSEGSKLWLSPTSSGAITTTTPAAPNHSVFLGYSLKSHASSGEIFVNPQNGYEIDELHNVLISSPSGSQVLYYDSASAIWRNTDISNLTSTSGQSNTSNLVLSSASNTYLWLLSSSPNAYESMINIASPSSTYSTLYFSNTTGAASYVDQGLPYTGGERWSIYLTTPSDPESGSIGGSDLAFDSYTNTGTYNSETMRLRRDGTVSTYGAIDISGSLVATQNWVQAQGYSTGGGGATSSIQYSTASLRNTSTTVYQKPTGMTGITLQADVLYKYEISILYQVISSNQVYKNRINHPAFTVGTAHNIIGTNTTQVSFLGLEKTLTGTQTDLSSTTSTNSGATLLAQRVNGFILPSASGVLSYEFAPTTNNTGADVFENSFMIVTPVTAV